MYDNAIPTSDVAVVVFWVLFAPVYFLLAPFIPAIERGVKRFFNRYGDALADAVLFLPMLAFSIGRLAISPFAWLLSRVRAWLDPSKEYRRYLGRRLAAEPPRSGLTAYEEYAAEINEIPDRHTRMMLRQTLRYYMPRPSAGAAIQAREDAGKSRAPLGLVRCLKRGEMPYSPRLKFLADI